MQIHNNMGHKYFKDDKMGNVYILKRKQDYCLSKFQQLASLDDILMLNNQCWFSMKEIKEILKNDYTLTY